MTSLKKMLNVVLIVFVLVLMFSVLINNFYTKPMLNSWQDIDDNSREFVDIYYDVEINMRVIKNILGQLNSADPILEKRYEKILNSYDDSFLRLKDGLDKMDDINKESMNLIEKIDGDFLYNRKVKKEDLNIELKILYDKTNEINNKITGLKELGYIKQEDIINLYYEEFITLKTNIDNFNSQLQEINIATTKSLLSLFNYILIFLFAIITTIAYFIDRIVRKNAQYMMRSIRMLNSSNYNMDMLPKIKSKFREEIEIERDINEIFEERKFINEIKEILSGELIIDEIINKLLYLVKDSLNTDRIGVAYIDYKNGKIIAEHGAFGYSKVLLGPGFKVSIENTSLKDIIKTKKGIITESIPDELRKRPDSASLQLLGKEGIKSNMIIALILNETVFGYLFFSSLKENNYSKKDLEIGIKIAQEISGILNTTYLTKKMFISTTNAFANLVEKKDNDTGDHILRMTHYSRIIAEGLIDYDDPEYTVNQGFVSDITNYAPIHDIGKVGIPDSILKKPGKLTPEERTIMETHAEIGGDILKEVQDNLVIFNRNFFKMGKEIAEGHHEKWDGSGYPKGLKANSIPLSARIVAIADVFDALSSKRVYKDDFGFENSVDIINEGSGKHFDPELVKVFNNSLDKIRGIYEKNKAK